MARSPWHSLRDSVWKLNVAAKRRAGSGDDYSWLTHTHKRKTDGLHFTWTVSNKAVITWFVKGLQQIPYPVISHDDTEQCHVAGIGETGIDCFRKDYFWVTYMMYLEK